MGERRASWIVLGGEGSAVEHAFPVLGEGAEPEPLTRPHCIPSLASLEHALGQASGVSRHESTALGQGLVDPATQTLPVFEEAYVRGVTVQSDGLIGRDGQPVAIQVIFRIRENRHTATAEDEPPAGARIGSYNQSTIGKFDSPGTSRWLLDATCTAADRSKRWRKVS